MNHTFHSATTRTSDQDLTTPNLKSLSSLYGLPQIPLRPPPPTNFHYDLAIVGQLWTSESIDLRHERLTSQVRHLPLRR